MMVMLWHYKDKQNTCIRRYLFEPNYIHNRMQYPRVKIWSVFAFLIDTDNYFLNKQ
jgi:hypothetical protein